MRNITIKLGRILCLLLTLSVSSCKKFVNISPPATQVVTANVFSTDANATSAMTGIYTGMESSYDLANLSLDLGLLSDELTNYSTQQLQIEYYQNAMQPRDIYNPWRDAYNYIYQANAVIEGLQNYSGVTSAAKQQLSGEAAFLRAFWFFYLTNCYGAIPMTTTANYAVNAVAARSSTGQAYQQIIADLKNAETLLNSNFVDVSDSLPTAERVRPTKWAAAALLARTYLYNGIYDSAEQQSTLVINNSSLFSLCQDLDSVFLMNNSEAIWQIPPPQPSSNLATPEGFIFNLSTAPNGNDLYNNATISTELYNSFDSGDMRQSEWIGNYPVGSTNYYFPNKYKLYESSSLGEYTVVMRLAEQYLIRAEARAQQGNTGGAVADLNLIRNRAGLAAYTGATDKGSLISAILHERQVELFTELGQRWFDLSRTGTINSVMSVVTPMKGGSWSPDWALFPVPQSDITADPKLNQNTGYH